MLRALLCLPLLGLASFAGVVEGDLPPATKRGDTLHYALYVPRAYDPAKPCPLVLAIHGGRGSGVKFANFLRCLGEARGAIIACPQGFEEIVEADGFWWRVNKAEVDALERFLEHVQKQYKIDPARVYVLGLADGGELAARFALGKERNLRGLILLNILWNWDGGLNAFKDLKVCVAACRDAEEKMAKLKAHAEDAYAAIAKAKIPAVLRLYPGASRTFFHDWESEFAKAFDWFDGKLDWPKAIAAEKAAPPPAPH